jgi:hypothetical protein
MRDAWDGDGLAYTMVLILLVWKTFWFDWLIQKTKKVSSPINEKFDDSQIQVLIDLS